MKRHVRVCSPAQRGVVLVLLSKDLGIERGRGASPRFICKKEVVPSLATRIAPYICTYLRAQGSLVALTKSTLV